ncbi:MAG: sn-glycerol-3-phosphate ABC transporter ATP-binding protein UgpC [Phycisphaerales bacterium]|nr:sn-glycerol-3-phosphate ABC transporter ATP-binding protein UgpC [Phycisphaerales bacterium]
MAEIALQQVEKVYPSGFHAVKSLSLSAGEGEFLVLLGPSGCGKSTTLRMIAGLEEATGGTISIGGRVVNDVHPKDRDIAMVFQNYALYPHMSVRENMAFALKLRKTPKPEIERRVNAAADMLGLRELLDRKPAALSGGQRQRVAVGRAIVREPKAFLFDEPLSNLDAKLRTTTRAEIKALHQRLKTTTVYVTHDQEEAMTLADRVAIMSGGVLHQHAPPMELYRTPVNRFVAGFLGTPPMNFLDGKLEGSGSGLAFGESASGGQRVALPMDWASRVSNAAGRDVVLGIRPQALDIAVHAPGDRPRIRGTVALVEPLGDQMDITLSIPSGRRLVARINAVTVKVGDALEMAIDMTKSHLFEPGEFGKNLTA